MLHRQHGQLDAGHPTDLTRPQPACVDDVLGVDDVIPIGDDVPGPVRTLLQTGDPRVEVHLCAAVLGADRIGVGDPVRIDAALVLVVQSTDEELLLEQRVHLLGLGHRDDLHVHAQIPTAGLRHPQPVEPLGRVGELQSAGQVDSAVLTGLGLDLLVQVDRVLLQASDVRVTVEGVHSTGRVPRRAGGQLLAFEQNDIDPAGLGQVVEHAGPDDTAADDDDLC